MTTTYILCTIYVIISRYRRAKGPQRQSSRLIPHVHTAHTNQYTIVVSISNHYEINADSGV